MAKKSSLYDELFNTVDRNKQRGENRPVNDRVHRLKILALIHARNWADDVGIKFQWSNITQPGQDTHYRVSAILDGKTLDWEDERGYRYGDDTDIDDACWAGCFSEAGPRSGKPEDRATALWAESIISLRMMAVFETGTRDDQLGREFAETHDGRIVYAA